jgi:hypothetical protein
VHGYHDDDVNRQQHNSAKPAGAQVRALAEQLSKLFAGNETGHHTFAGLEKTEDGFNKCMKVNFKGGLPTVDEWEAYLLGTSGIGVTPIRMDAQVAFACIDIDIHGPSYYRFDPINVVSKLKHRKKQLPLIPINSKNFGLHLFVFFKELVPGIMVRRVLVTWTKALDFPDAEIFPKQDVPNKDGKGSNLWMPYFGWLSESQEFPQQAMIDERAHCFRSRSSSKKQPARQSRVKSWEAWNYAVPADPAKRARRKRNGVHATERRNGPR